MNTITLRERLLHIKTEQNIDKDVLLARALGVSPQAVSAWFKGTTLTMDPKAAFRAQKLWGYSAEWVFDGTGPIRVKDAIAEQTPFQYGRNSLDLRVLSPVLAEVIKAAYQTALRLDGAPL